MLYISHILSVDILEKLLLKLCIKYPFKNHSNLFDASYSNLSNSDTQCLHFKNSLVCIDPATVL